MPTEELWTDENGKTVTPELGEYETMERPAFDSQSIPKNAFYVFDGDVKVTVTLENLKGIDVDDRSLHVYNCDYCYNVIEKYVLVPLETDGGYLPVTRDEYGIHFDKDRGQMIIIIPKDVKEKMSSGIFFRCRKVRPGKVCSEAYNGECDVFL